MKERYRAYRRENGVFYSVDTVTKQRHSLETSDPSAARRIINSKNEACQQHGEDWRACDEVLDTVNALSKPGDAAKVLRDIRKRQKGEGESTDTENVVSMTPALAAQFLCAAFEKASELPEEEQFKLCGLLYDVNDAWAASGIDETTLKRFDEQISKNRAMNVADGIKVITPETQRAIAA